MGDIKQKVTFQAAPERVFRALMDEKEHASFTGEKAKISAKVGGRFRCYGDYIEGVNLDLADGRRIVQAWRARNWPEGAWSIATFTLTPAAGGKTALAFSHTGVPETHRAAHEQGWKDFYWSRMKKHFAGK